MRRNVPLPITGPKMRATPEQRGWTKRYIPGAVVWVYHPPETPYYVSTRYAVTEDAPTPPGDAAPVVVRLQYDPDTAVLADFTMPYREWLEMEAETLTWLLERERRRRCGIRAPVPVPLNKKVPLTRTLLQAGPLLPTTPAPDEPEELEEDPDAE